MTVKNLPALEKALLAELPGFSIAGNLLLMSPMERILRAIYFESSSYDKSAFSVSAFVMPLCVPTEHLSFNFGNRVRHKGGGDRWTMSMPNLMAELGAALKEQAVPFLAKVDSLLAFADMATAFSGNLHTPKAMAFALARAGQDRRAVSVLDELLAQVDPNIAWQQTIAKQANALKTDLLERPVEAHRQLEEWEIETTRKLGLEQFL